MDSTTNRLSGSVPLAAILVVIVGLIHVLSGIAAISGSDSVTTEVNDVLYDINVESWGWFWLIGGVAQLLTAVLLFARNPVAAAVAVCGASLGALLTVFLIFVAPIWAITVLALEVAIIWKIT
ncbi:MAG: hypothetical protein J4O14_08150, partial [Chloroflexi bacterium]|nr:hypothetical protein [Chloroflexota bacterium]MCI0818228.1 hypothetical protein [Chloroflexota bacterium]MCI0886150.1 hypothetical protein [Chloroflexota bacterium]